MAPIAGAEPGTLWAERVSRQLLERLGARWRHTQGVVGRAREICRAMDPGEADLLIAAACLHDIGYAPELRESGFHPLDGARFVRAALANKARTIRIPVHVVDKLNKIGRAERKLVTELGREPTADEIAELTRIEPEEVDSIKRSAHAPVSLEKPGHERLAGLVAYHGAAEVEAAERGLLGELAEFEDERSAVSRALTYCDLTTDEEGRRVEPLERLRGIRERYGPGAPETLAAERSVPRLLDDVRMVEATLVAADSPTGAGDPTTRR